MVTWTLGGYRWGVASAVPMNPQQCSHLILNRIHKHMGHPFHVDLAQFKVCFPSPLHPLKICAINLHSCVGGGYTSHPVSVTALPPALFTLQLQLCCQYKIFGTTQTNFTCAKLSPKVATVYTSPWSYHLWQNMESSR